MRDIMYIFMWLYQTTHRAYTCTYISMTNKSVMTFVYVNKTSVWHQICVIIWHEQELSANTLANAWRVFREILYNLHIDSFSANSKHPVQHYRCRNDKVSTQALIAVGLMVEALLICSRNIFQYESQERMWYFRLTVVLPQLYVKMCAKSGGCKK